MTIHFHGQLFLMQTQAIQATAIIITADTAIADQIAATTVDLTRATAMADSIQVMAVSTEAMVVLTVVEDTTN